MQSKCSKSKPIPNAVVDMIILTTLLLNYAIIFVFYLAVNCPWKTTAVIPEFDK